MELLSKVCNRAIIENKSEYNKYRATLSKENDKSLYKKYTMNNNNLDDINRILNDYISTHKKNFDFYFNKCEFVVEFDNNFIANIETSYLLIQIILI